jgi:hypothetical protein
MLDPNPYIRIRIEINEDPQHCKIQCTFLSTLVATTDPSLPQVDTTRSRQLTPGHPVLIATSSDLQMTPAASLGEEPGLSQVLTVKLSDLKARPSSTTADAAQANSRSVPVGCAAKRPRSEPYLSPTEASDTGVTSHSDSHLFLDAKKRRRVEDHLAFGAGTPSLEAVLSTREGQKPLHRADGSNTANGRKEGGPLIEAVSSANTEPLVESSYGRKKIHSFEAALAKENIFLHDAGGSALNELNVDAGGGFEADDWETQDFEPRADCSVEENKCRNETSRGEVGFSTAGGKKICISEDAVLKAKSLLASTNSDVSHGTRVLGGKKDYSLENVLEVDTCSSANVSSSVSEVKQVAFATAGGKRIDISQDAISRAKTLMGKDAPVTCSVSEAGKTNENAQTLIGEDLSTNASLTKEVSLNISSVGVAEHVAGVASGGGKKICISEEAVLKAQAFMREAVPEIPSDSSRNSSFSGFATAGGKKVIISEEAITKARTLFEDNLPEARPVNWDVSTCIGFSTAAGKKVSISQEAIARAKALFDDKLPEALSGHSEVPGASRVRSFTGFATAAGKKVSISEEAIVKAKALFDNKLPEGLSGRSEVPDSSRNSTSFVGFATAGGKKVSISEEAIAKARASLENKLPAQTGFATAAGKKVPEEAVIRAKALLEDKLPVAPAGNCGVASLTGFATASGKKVSISEEAIAKAKALFDDGLPEALSGHSEVQDSSRNTSFVGFATAGGKKVSISEEAIAKAKTLFDKLPVDPVNNSQFASSTGFATAAGKKVNISKEATVKAKTLFDKLPVDPANNTEFASSTGFATAAGKKVNISKEAIVKAKAFLEDGLKGDSKIVAHAKSKASPENAIPKPQLTANAVAPSVGFATAGGKRVSVSKEAIAKAKAFMGDVIPGTPSEISTNAGFVAASGSKMALPDKAASSVGFATAGGKKIAVSEEAIAKAKLVLCESSPGDSVLIGEKEEKYKFISEASEKAILKDISNGDSCRSPCAAGELEVRQLCEKSKQCFLFSCGRNYIHRGEAQVLFELYLFVSCFFAQWQNPYPDQRKKLSVCIFEHLKNFEKFGYLWHVQ